MIDAKVDTGSFATYVMNSDNEQALLGMDILSLGDFSASHQVDAKGLLWMDFQFCLLDPSFSL